MIIQQEQTREEKLEAAFCQFIKLVVDLRARTILFDDQHGSYFARDKRRAQKRVDEALKNMGITEEMDLRNISLSFIKEKLQN